MDEGLYQVTYKRICAGFVIKDGRVTECAPILKNKINFWKTIAKRIKGVENMGKNFPIIRIVPGLIYTLHAVGIIGRF